jgi:hypothetical protein
MTSPAEFSVVRGNPTDEELAAAIAVVQAALTAAELEAAKHAAEADNVSAWHLNASMLRGQVTPGAGQWRASLRRGL